MPAKPLISFFTLRIEPDAHALEAPSNQTLLAAMEQAGIEWPSSCRNGTCRTCMGQLAQGQVRYDIEWPGLSPEEKRDRYVLPCAAFAGTPLVLRRPA